MGKRSSENEVFVVFLKVTSGLKHFLKSSKLYEYKSRVPSRLAVIRYQCWSSRPVEKRFTLREIERAVLHIHPEWRKKIRAYIYIHTVQRESPPSERFSLFYFIFFFPRFTSSLANPKRRRWRFRSLYRYKNWPIKCLAHFKSFQLVGFLYSKGRLRNFLFFEPLQRLRSNVLFCRRRI